MYEWKFSPLSQVRLWLCVSKYTIDGNMMEYVTNVLTDVFLIVFGKPDLWGIR